MADLIERQIAIDAIKTWGLIDGLSEGQAIEILSDENKVPSAESEIIRCPDCYYNDGTAYCEFHFRNVKAKDFCSWAERRE